MMSKKFIDLIDREQKNKENTYVDFLVMMRTCDYYYTIENYSSSNYCDHVENYYTSDYENQILYKKPFVLPSKDDIFKNNNINNKLEKKEKIKKNIEVNIETLGDLIDIANNNAFEYNVEYNIDLKVLHNIKDDLIKLNSMIGLTEFKKSILSQLLYFIQNLHISKESDFMHTVIYGPPGTGKTEIANILGSIYSNIGVLKNNKFKAVSRSDLIAGYLGQTALKTSKVIEECLGGCLFIDEAYSLANGKDGDSYSRECIDTLCESLSKYKSDLMVIIAGYKDELQETFFKANRGLESRFIWRFHLEEYDHQELMAILKKKIQENEWNLKIDDHDLNKWFKTNYKTFKYFGRDVELLFSYIKMAHGRRLYGKSSDLRKCINMEDLENGFQQFNEHSKIKTKEKILGMYV